MGDPPSIMLCSRERINIINVDNDFRSPYKITLVISAHRAHLIRTNPHRLPVWDTLVSIRVLSNLIPSHQRLLVSIYLSRCYVLFSPAYACIKIGSAMQI